MKATEVVEKLSVRFPNEPEYIQAGSQVLRMNTTNIPSSNDPT